jgi:hypothetical protein
LPGFGPERFGEAHHRVVVGAAATCDDLLDPMIQVSL